MKKYFILLLFTVFSVYTIAAPMYQKTSLKGHVADAADKAPLVGVTIYIPELSVGTTTDIDGNYVLEDLPCKQITLQVSYLGHQTIIEKLNLASVTTKDFLLKESNAFINEVIVTGLSGNTLLKDSPTPVSVVSSADLQATSSTNVIDAIAHQPGISQITTGSGISKPVIRGLGYNRIVTVNNDVRQEGQQWGDEHGIEIDPQTVDHVEILKGPASLMYGSDAMAGVVIFHDAPTLSKGKMTANVSSEYQTNNGLFDYSFNFAGNLSGIVWNTRYSEKMAHAYKNKYDGYVLGSQFRERALSGMLGVNKNWGYSHLTLSYYHLTPSMTEGERDEKTGEFVKPILSNGEESECIASHHDLTTYGKGLPYQQIHHYKAILNNSVYIGNGQLNAIIGYQQNRRQEFEDVASPDKPGLDFMLHTVNYDVHYSLEQKDGLNVTGGVNGMYQRSLNKGDEYLIPAYALFDFGAFVTSGYKKDKINISGGLRFDTRHLHSFALEDRFEKFSRTFNGITGSIGMVYEMTPQMNVRLNAARGFRAPNLSELSANGEHEGTFRYELGNNNLKAENSWQVDLGWDYTSAIFTAQLSAFANFIDNYVYTKRLDYETDNLPTYQYMQGNSRLMGMEASIDIHPIDILHFENSFCFVNAVQLHQPAESKYLPMTPAPRWNTDIKLDILRHGTLVNNLFVKMGMECDFRQSHYYSANATETATPGYVLLNASMGGDVIVKGHKILSLYILGENLTDKAYQSHLSRLKYSAVNNVTGRTGVFNMGRNIGFKVIVPVEF